MSGSYSIACQWPGTSAHVGPYVPVIYIHTNLLRYPPFNLLSFE